MRHALPLATAILIVTAWAFPSARADNLDPPWIHLLSKELSKEDAACMAPANSVAAIIALKQWKPGITDDDLMSDAYMFGDPASNQNELRSLIGYADEHASWYPDVARLDYWIRCHKGK
jgi:hypothetical protein